MVLTRRSRAEWDVAPQQGGFLLSMMPGALMLMFMLRWVLILILLLMLRWVLIFDVDDEVEVELGVDNDVNAEVGVEVEVDVDFEVGVDIDFDVEVGV